MKRTLSVILTFVMLLTIIPISVTTAHASSITEITTIDLSRLVVGGTKPYTFG